MNAPTSDKQREVVRKVVAAWHDGRRCEQRFEFQTEGDEGPMAHKRWFTLIEALTHVPPDHSVTFHVERRDVEDGDGEFLSANVYEHPPGWGPGGTFDQDDPTHGWPGSGSHPDDRWRDRIVFGITADGPAAMERLLVDAILKRWPAPYRSLAAWVRP